MTDAYYPVISVVAPTDAMEARGSRQKFWVSFEGDENDWLLKFPRPDNGEHWAEKVAAEIGHLIGVNCARVELARCMWQIGEEQSQKDRDVNQLGTICRSFTDLQIEEYSMTTLYLAWQNLQSRLWFPIGRLVQHETEHGGYEFAYVRGAEQAKKLAKFREIPGFPQLYKYYLSDELFSTFRYRVMNRSRTDRPEYLRQLGIDVANWNEITELSVSGGHSQIDNFEIFPAIEPDSDGRFQTQCILHGLRHTNQHGIEASEKLEVGGNLRLAFELNNPSTTHSLLVYTQNYNPLGWLPQYLVDCIYQENTWMVTDINIAVAQVNLDAPLSHRLLVHLSGQLPKGFSPMQDLEQYQPIAASEWTVAERETTC